MNSKKDPSTKAADFYKENKEFLVERREKLDIER